MSGQSDDTQRARYIEGAAAYTNGDYAAALAIFQELVGSGYAKAAAYLAELYLEGQGVERDIDRAIALLLQAASLGDDNAAFNLGAMYRSGGYGVPRDDCKSKEYFRLAQELGCKIPVEKYL